MNKEFLENLKNTTPELPEFKGYFEADDELRPIAQEIKKQSYYKYFIPVTCNIFSQKN